MNWIPTHLAYRQTGYFSRIIMDYLDQAGPSSSSSTGILSPFFAHPVSYEGMRASLDARKRTVVDRAALVSVLKEQYAGMPVSATVQTNIESLLQDNVFTVCTAHQPAIFTGTLYFIYKILHTVRLAEELTKRLPGNRFVPVFYMGSEDADLDELGKVFLGGEPLVWETRQKGAVGRMKPKGLEKLLVRIEGELSVQPYGQELMGILKEAYLESPDIQTATFRLLHKLFAAYGLIVLIPDHPALKRQMIPVFESDLFEGTPARIVEGTIAELSKEYKVQANPRDINLFYLKDDLRGRIERTGEVFKVHDSELVFTEKEMREELARFPERFSPNVILRGLFQETILPNIAFIGGGGETAYWLELKALFGHYKRPFPVLVLRNSFLLVEAGWRHKLERAGLPVTAIFRPEADLLNELVRQLSSQQLNLEKELSEATAYYSHLQTIARSVDPTLGQHVEALQVKAVEPLRELEKKLLKAEKRKYSELERQLQALKAALFPRGGLQERIDNFMPWYAARGTQFIRDLYEHSLSLEQEFVILTEG